MPTPSPLLMVAGSITANVATPLTLVVATTGNELSAFAGSTSNDPRGASAVAGMAYCPIGGTANSSNGKSMVIKFSMTGFQDPILTFATRQSGTTAYTTHQWAWSTDGTTFTNFGTNTAPTTTSFVTKTVDLSTINNVDGAATVYLKVTFTGCTASSSNNRLDNIVINATPSSSTAPTLSPDASSNNVDNNIDITFTDDAAWRAAITAVKIGGTALTATTDYVISAGNIQLKPSGGNTLLTTAGSKAVTVEATGYSVGSVNQQIDAGAPTANSISSISPSLALSTASTVTCTAKDQYNNLVSGYTFKYDVEIGRASCRERVYVSV